MPPNTDCSASISCGGVRSNRGGPSPPSSPTARRPAPDVIPPPLTPDSKPDRRDLDGPPPEVYDSTFEYCRISGCGAHPFRLTRDDARRLRPPAQPGLCTQLGTKVWATPGNHVHDLGMRV